MSTKQLGIFLIGGAVIVLVMLIGGYINQQKTSVEQKSDSQVKEIRAKSVIFKDLTSAEAQSLIQQNRQNKNFVIVDVRTPSEYAGGHIENAINIDYSASNFREELVKLDKSKAYLIYCRSGSRSKKTFELMEGLGFGEVYNLVSGITDWEAQGLPTVK